MSELSEQQIAEFWRTGCIVCDDAASIDEITAMRADLNVWIEESRTFTGAYGETLDGRPRFDLQPGHNAVRPGLRRIASPTEISETYFNVVKKSRMLDMLADLIGPDLRLHHTKINCKLPGAGTVVDWHQDFNFDPHSNDDVVTCLMFLDEVTPENGPLMTAPGSHRGPIFSHWQGGRFTGAIAKETSAQFERDAIMHVGPAGSVCFMHSRVAHGSKANLSTGSRNLFIAVIAAADAVPLAPNPLPSVHAGLMLKGTEPGRIRSAAFEMETPEIPDGASFFVQQSSQAERA